MKKPPWGSQQWADLLLRALSNGRRPDDLPLPDQLLRRTPLPAREDLCTIFRWLYHDHPRRLEAMLALYGHGVLPDDRDEDDPLWTTMIDWLEEPPPGGGPGWSRLIRKLGRNPHQRASRPP